MQWDDEQMNVNLDNAIPGEGSIVKKTYGHLHWRMLPGKMVFFLYFGAKYVFMTFIIPFLVSIGLHPSKAGIIVGSRYVVASLGGAVFGLFLTKTKRYNVITILAIVSSTLAIIGLAFMPYVIGENTVKDSSKGTLQTISHSDHSTIFITSLAFCCLYAFFDGSLHSLSVLFNLAYCKHHGKNNSYAWQRMCGSFGYALLPFFSGIVIQYWHLGVISNYLLALMLFCVIQIPLIPAFVYLSRDFQSNLENSEQPPFQFEIITKTLRNPLLLLCLFLQVAFGAANAIEYGYLLVCMQSYMSNGTPLVLAWALLTRSAFEGVISPLIGKLNVRLRAPYPFIALSAVAYGIAFLMYYQAADGRYIIAINMLNGAAYATYLFPITEEVNRLTPLDSKAFVFALSYACYSGLGAALGSVSGGFLFENYGPKLYLFTSIVMFILAFALIVFVVWRKCCVLCNII